jgi:hypothetical protein
MIHMIRFTCIEDIQSPLNDILCSVKRSEPASWVRRLLYLLALWYISIYRTRSAPAVDGKWLFSSIGWQTTYIGWQTTYIGCQFTSIVLQFTSIGLQFMYIGIESTETDTLRPLVTLYVHWWHFTSIGDTSRPLDDWTFASIEPFSNRHPNIGSLVEGSRPPSQRTSPEWNES